MTGKGGVAQKGFEEVVLSQLTGWTYWEIVTQPTWFLERLALYIEAKNVAEKVEASKRELKLKSSQ